MNNTWIKLYRKINEHAIIGDSNALQLFIWVLVSVDRENGKVKAGRYWLSKLLNMKPSTVYRALQRLEKKYKIVTLVANSEYTTISLLNWEKYQAKPEEVTPLANSEVAASGQQENTIQEIRIKNKDKEMDNSIQYLLKIPSNDLAEFTIAFICTDRQVISKGQSLYDYCESKGKKYKDYKAFLRNALRKDFGNRLLEVNTMPEAPIEISEEQRLRNITKLAEIRKKLTEKLAN